MKMTPVGGVGGSVISADAAVHLDSSSREEQPVSSVWRIQAVLQERGPVGGID